MPARASYVLKPTDPVQGKDGWDITAALEKVKASARASHDAASEAAAVAVEKRVRHVRARCIAQHFSGLHYVNSLMD